jgi:RNA polymerase sigma-70 factor (ECF subfamily)
MTSVNDVENDPAWAQAGLEDRRRAAFQRLTQQRLDRAYRLAASLLGAVEAQDAVHDAAVQACTKWATLRDETLFEAWFDRIVVNICRDRIRRSSASSRAIIHLHNADKSDPTEVVHELDSLGRAIRMLSADHRIVITLRYLDDLSCEEIATRTGQNLGTVKSRLHYALKELRAAYEAGRRVEGRLE